MALPFADYGKDAETLLVKEYPVEGTYKFSAELTNADGATVTTNVTRSVDPKKANEETLVGEVEPKYNWSSKNVEFRAKFSTKNEYSVGGSISDLVNKGSKLSLDFINKLQKPKAPKPNEPAVTTFLTDVKFGASCKSDTVNGGLEITYPLSEDDRNAKVVAHASVAKNEFNVAAQVDYTHTGDKTLPYVKELTLADQLQGGFHALYKTGTYQGGVNVDYERAKPDTDKKDEKVNVNDAVKVAITYVQDVAPATRAGLKFFGDYRDLSKAGVVVGGNYKVDDITTLRSKVTVDATKSLRTAVGLTHKVSSRFAVTFGFDLNGNQLVNPTAAGSPHSFGVEFKWK